MPHAKLQELRQSPGIGHSNGIRLYFRMLPYYKSSGYHALPVSFHLSQNAAVKTSTLVYALHPMQAV